MARAARLRLKRRYAAVLTACLDFRDNAATIGGDFGRTFESTSKGLKLQEAPAVACRRNADRHSIFIVKRVDGSTEIAQFLGALMRFPIRAPSQQQAGNDRG
ncbi:MAG: hypothetical protein E5Y61_19330 [Mesorhizobium sp.]|nr:MAG: hypothetical protein E5Y61_19330 [Mesorhizobium sp.]TIN07819.1 MAG: hypothetical protein E5Y59_16480 [Mesorhizobium sp.]